MPTTIVATAEPNATPAPRVKLDITWTGATSAIVVRRDPDGHALPVTLGSPAALVAGAVTLYDYESPFGVAVTYEATSGSATIMSSPVTLDVDQVWLRHPAVPALSMPVELAGDGEPMYAANRAKLEPLGRQTPIVITDGKRKSKTTTLAVRTYSLAERQKLLDLLDDCGVLLLDVPPSLGWRLTRQYMAIGDATVPPIVPENPHTPWDQWQLPYDVVDRSVIGADTAWTYASVLTGYATYAAVRAAFATYADLLANRPIGSTAPPPPSIPDGTATVTTYTPDPAAPSQSTYQVTVNGQASYVYPTYDNAAAPQPHWGKFTTFSMGTGSVLVEVTTNYDVASVRVRPTIQDVPATIVNARKIQFTLTRPGNYSVEINADPQQTDSTKPGSTNQIDPLFIFASPPESKPSKTDPNVYAYFSEGGIYTGGSVVPGNGATVTVPTSGDLVVPAGKTVYLEGGAIFKGRIICGATSATGTAASGITVDGRGVVDATWQATPGNPVKVYKCSNTSVTGIVALGCNKWGFRVFGCGATGPVSIKNVRVLNWADPAKAGSPTPDGIDCLGSQQVTFDGVFVRSRDDSITMKTNKTSMDGDWSADCFNNTVRNFVVWNGDAGNALEIGFETGPSPRSIYNILYEHGDVIHKTTNPANTAVATDYARGAITIHNREAGNIHNITYDDIRVEDVIGDAGSTTGGKDGLFYIDSVATAVATSDILLRDISVIRAQAALSIQVRGGDSTHRVVNVTFENLTINGTPIPDSTAAAAAGYVSSNVTNVLFKPSQAGGATGVTLAPVADTWVQNNGTSKGPTDQYLLVKNSPTASLDRMAFLRFDATAAGLSTCSAAKLRLWKIRNDSGAATAIGVYQVASDTWSEPDLVWGTAPPLGTLISTVSVGAQQQYYEWDVTAYVAAQLAGDDLISFGLWEPAGADNMVSFNSLDAAANIPYLVITP
jgi:hypothetical protein